MVKSLAGIAAFVVALGAAIFITKFYSTPDAPPPPPPPVAPSPAPAPTAQADAPEGPSSVSHKARMITLDLAARKTHTTLSIERDPSAPAPERLWVRTYFFSTEAAGKVWSGDAVEILRPLSGGTRATVTATAACTWCGETGAPRGGYYARVVVSAVSKEATRLSEGRLDFDISKSTPVVVQEGAKNRR